MPKGVVQCKPPRPAYVKGAGQGFIPVMCTQYDPRFRIKEHHDLLAKIPKKQGLIKTFLQEIHLASKFPYKGSKSRLGDAGIATHITVADARHDKSLELSFIGA